MQKTPNELSLYFRQEYHLTVSNLISELEKLIEDNKADVPLKFIWGNSLGDMVRHPYFKNDVVIHSGGGKNLQEALDMFRKFDNDSPVWIVSQYFKCSPVLALVYGNKYLYSENEAIYLFGKEIDCALIT